MFSADLDSDSTQSAQNGFGFKEMDSNSDKTDSDSSSKNGFEFKQRIRIRIRTGFEFRNGFIQLQFCCVVAVSRAYRGSVCKGCGVALHETGAGLFRSKTQIFFKFFHQNFLFFHHFFFKKIKTKSPGTVLPAPYFPVP